MDSGRKSGHGKVIYCYYDLCEKIWGGSPATNQLVGGAETTDLNLPSSEVVQTEARDSDREDETEDTVQNADTVTQDDPSPISQQESAEQSSSLLRRKCKEQLDNTLSSYKSQKMKRKVPVDTQMVQLAEDELDIKKKMMDRMETMGNHHRETMKELTSNLKALNESVTGAFSMLQQVLLCPLGPTYFQPQHYSCPPAFPPNHGPPMGHGIGNLPTQEYASAHVSTSSPISVVSSYNSSAPVLSLISFEEEEFDRGP